MTDGEALEARVRRLEEEMAILRNYVALLRWIAPLALGAAGIVIGRFL